MAPQDIYIVLMVLILVLTQYFYITDNGLPQNFTAYVRDLNGCEASFVLPTIQPLQPLIASVVRTQTIDCNQPEIITINALGGTNSYTYQYNGPTPAPAIPVVTQGVSP